MSADNRVLFDPPGPRARRRIRWATFTSAVVIVLVAALALRQLGSHGQLSADRWQPFTTAPYLQVLWTGLQGTLRAAAMSAVIAFPLGLLLGLLRMSRNVVVARCAAAYVELFRSVPVLLLIFVFLLGLPSLGVNLPIYWKLVVPIALANAALIAEVFRAGVRALDRGQAMAGDALGLRHGQVLWLIVIPQAVRLVLPSLITQFVLVLKDSTLGYVVSYPEMLKQADFLTARTGLLFQTYVIIAVLFIIVNATLSQGADALDRRLNRRPARPEAGRVSSGPTGSSQTLADRPA
jgi:glutamate transport system permease protein